MNIQAIEIMLNVYESDATLEAETNLSDRAVVLDFIALAEKSIQAQGQNAEAVSLAGRLASFKRYLTTIDTRLSDRLRRQIRAGKYTPGELRLEFNQYTRYTPWQKGQDHSGPDALDALLDGILELDYYLRLTESPGPNMNNYEPTPARAVLEAVDGAGINADDIFYDLGSGLGRVVILTHLVSGARAKGVEIDPPLYGRARGCADKLQLAGVEFIHSDVREIDYGDGSVFFMYTPFTGDIFEAALDRLRQVAERHPIRLCTFGPCTASVAEQPWLRSEGDDVGNPFKMTIFHSRSAAP